MFMGTADEEVSIMICQHVANRSIGATFAVSFYVGANHDFNDPGECHGNGGRDEEGGGGWR